ncbi:MAG TPA: Ni/Fe-hydrogenase, b-type cytochrome subunit [Vicinamibacterales bacterium]|jgi:Ni/Fe-hydrogenase 1 B-type cytochrome subunit|nr:Ni/Fe-hydrogenase, b-type cytochrome subunit [Vicinamibacterales bacterium]
MTPAAEGRLVRVYVWEVPVRIAHWLIATSIMVLSATGFYIGWPFVTVSGPAGPSFFMGWVRVIHGYTAYVFIAAVLLRVIWMFTGNNYAHWDKFIPVHPSRRRGMWPTIRFYLFGPRRPPGFVGHNPLAGLAYLLVFGQYLLVIGTGLVMRGAGAPADSLLRWFTTCEGMFGGLYVVRWIHHVVMYLLLGFAVHHVYSSVLMSGVERNATVESIFSGYKFVSEAELMESTYRFVNRRGEVDE